MNPGVLFNFGSVTIAVVLFAAIIVCNELSFRVGKIVQERHDDEVKALTGAVQASILGLLALLLGFTFSMSMQRFDDRSMALIDEANAIATTMLRADLLPAEQRKAVKVQLNEYLKARVALGSIDLTRNEQRREYRNRIAAIQSELWTLTVAAAEADPRPVTTGTFLTSLNAMIDSEGKRSALLQAHVPEPIVLLLLFVFIASIGMMGYSSGLSGKRILAPLLLVSLLVTLIVFIIIDLDRPKRGMIKVNQNALTELVQMKTSEAEDAR